MKKLLFVLLAISLGAGVLVSQGQTANPDVYAYLQGDIWKYNINAGTASKITQSGFNGGPVLSPDGRTIAFLETPSEFVKQVNSGTVAQRAGSPPADIWKLDIATQSLSKIADQVGASTFGIVRSFPTWSPDSRKLAWLQIDPNLQSLEQATLQVHDLDTGHTSSIANGVSLGYQESDIRMPVLLWGESGIARLLFTYLYGNQSPFLFMEVYDPASNEATQFNLQLAADYSNMVRDFMWASHQGRSVILIGVQDYWQVLDPLDGSRARLSDPPRLKSRFVSGGLELIPIATAAASGGWEFHWQASGGGNIYDTGFIGRDVDFDNQPALSSDGWQVSWHSGDRISTWHTGMTAEERPEASDPSVHKAFPIPDPISVVWSPVEWVTTGSVVAVESIQTAEPTPESCSLTAQLSVGQQAIVSPGLANRVRAAASLQAEVIGSIQPSEVANVLQGPVCSGGYYWYWVQNERISGWTVEGVEGVYWLLYHVDCQNSPPTRLGKDMSAVVTSGQDNNIRNGVGSTATDIVGLLPAGAGFRITGHPQCDEDGLRWYPVEYGQTVGWTASGQGDEYWIEPASGQATG